ncbi:MAG: metallophosphoesterase [Clostridia bacterium]|nr:metallophosphoesterase [Clostridia bacterium]
MSIKVFIDKYANQIQAMNPKYDVIYEVSKDNPIVFENSAEVRLSMAVIADTHLPNRESAELNLGNTFEDLANSQEKFDAFLMAGDIADYGTNNEYERFFRVLDNQKVVENIFVTMGNHDARFFFKKNCRIVMNKVEEYLKIKTQGKSYYSYDIKGYTFIVICTEKRVLEKAYISKEQMAFLDKELERGTRDGKPVFVMCHQPFAETHGLPEVWKTGDMGEQNDEVRAIMEKYSNVFFINGHLHGGIFEKLPETLNEEKGVYSISIPGYRKPNNFGITDCGVGYYCEVYDDKVVFKARNFLKGENIEGDYTRLEYAIK